jgi:glycosyltransferase involved in cell wall biosynthesis
MRIGIATVQVPFVNGGAELHAEGLRRALLRAGHKVDVITVPFHFFPHEQTRRDMAFCEESDFGSFNGYQVDRLIGLTFPAYLAQHPAKVLWVLHQHRAAYDLMGTTFDGGLSRTAEGRSFAEEIHAADRRAFDRAHAVFANSGTVAARIARWNGVDARPLYHPPPFADDFYNAEPWPYVFFPSRLEALKRQDLLIRAAAQVKSPISFVIAGEGGQCQNLLRLAESLGLMDRVRFVGNVRHAEKLAFYARCLAVFFGPRDEDYGYVTLEAMLAGKPVITCSDSGGPLEFVHDGETGFVTSPEPKAVANAIEKLAADRQRAFDMGHAARQRWNTQGISWDHVVETLLA